MRAARWCGPSENVGDMLTWWLLDEETHQLIARSCIEPRKDDLNPNLRLGMPNVQADADGNTFVYTQDGLPEPFTLAELYGDEEGSPPATRQTVESVDAEDDDDGRPVVETVDEDDDDEDAEEIPIPTRPPPSARPQAHAMPRPKLPR